MDSLLQILEFPLSALLALMFLLVAFALHRFARESRLVSMLGHVRTARILLAVGAVALAVEGTWSVPLHASVGFAAYALVLLLSLAITLMNGIERRARWGFLLNHAGVFLIVWAALFGAPDVSRSKIVIDRSEPVAYAYAKDGTLVSLPFGVKLEEFRVDYYEDGRSPRQYTSQILIDGERREVAVNSPARYHGYTFFQDNYDHVSERYSVLLVVRDPWLPVTYLGMLLLAVGSVMLLFGRWHARLVVPVTLVLTLLFTVVTVAKINFGSLMPALRSWWFVPHLLVYMVAYSLMALSLVLWLVERVKQNGHWQPVSDNLMRSSSALLIIGMLCGAVWARQAWGDYWAWDPKENWAAATWFLSLVHLHLQSKRGYKPICVLLLAFLSLQITWYGVNYLPSAQNSMHTYN